MNQILVTEKLYVTPELRRKKSFYKTIFFISIFLVFLLSSYYIYAEYDRNKSEEVSQAILSEVEDNTVRDSSADDSIIIVLNETEADQQTVVDEVEETPTTQEITVDGSTYSIEGRIRIPDIDVDYPILSETSEKLLEISVNKFHPDYLKPNDIGNYCIVGHNYRNGKMFGRLNELSYGDIVEIEDLTGRTIEYEVYYKYVVEPTDTSCTSQLANGERLTTRELTLITCTNYGTQRLVVKCREV